MAGAEFKITKLSDGTSFNLTTGADGTAVSDKLIPGDYKIVEVKPALGYVANNDEYEVTVTSDGVCIKRITNKPIKINIEGSKTWDDAENQDGKRPEEITVNLLKNGAVFKTTTVKETDNWSWKFENLDKYENGTEITYSISEEAVEGYSTEVTGYDIKNSYTPGKTSIQVAKSWQDNNNQDGKRPNSVTVQLLADGVEVPGKTLTLTETNHWTGSFTDLDEYKDGTKIEYKIKEVEVGNGYEAVITGSMEEGYVVTNTREPEKSKTILPKTGDNFNVVLYGLVFVLAGLGLSILGVFRKKIK